MNIHLYNKAIDSGLSPEWAEKVAIGNITLSDALGDMDMDEESTSFFKDESCESDILLSYELGCLTRSGYTFDFDQLPF